VLGSICAWVRVWREGDGSPKATLTVSDGIHSTTWCWDEGSGEIAFLGKAAGWITSPKAIGASHMTGLTKGIAGTRQISPDLHLNVLANGARVP